MHANDTKCIRNWKCMNLNFLILKTRLNPIVGDDPLALCYNDHITKKHVNGETTRNRHEKSCGILWKRVAAMPLQQSVSFVS